MAEKYGGAIDVSGEALDEPTIWTLVEERCRRAAERTGATDRFAFTKRLCDGLFDCPRNMPCDDDHEHDERCEFELAFASTPHAHAHWTGWTNG